MKGWTLRTPAAKPEPQAGVPAHKESRTHGTKAAPTIITIALGMLPAVGGAEEMQAPLLELFGDNEIPNQIIDGIVGIGSDVMAFLMRMVPFPF